MPCIGIGVQQFDYCIPDDGTVGPVEATREDNSLEGMLAFMSSLLLTYLCKGYGHPAPAIQFERVDSIGLL